jgi:integrase
MSLSAFVPANTQKARTTAISAFARMLENEGVSMELFRASILTDPSGKRLAATMDRFGYYLATNEGKKGKLARNTAMSYYRNVKLWLFDEFPHLRLPTEMNLLKQGKTLDKHCLKREEGGLVNKAPPCTKEDLGALIRYVYSTARAASDYQDAALACLMWHCFGRSSDLGFLRKQHVSVSADGVFYLRLLRVKTAEEQGLTLVPDKQDFATCPLHSLAVALAMQAAPCAALLSQLPELVTATAEPLQSGVPLNDLLAADPGSLSIALTPSSHAARASTPQSAVVAPPSLASTTAQEQVRSTAASSTPRSGEKTRAGDGVQAYVNRLLKRVAKPAGATTDLTSHSFRRGGAQHANGDDRLAAQWIFDRGAWDMSKLNKGFAYVYNTPREDRKVARVLSGWKVDAAPVVLDVAVLDHGAQEQLARLRGFVFSTCTGLKEQRLNVSSKVLTVLTAYLVRYYPQLKEIAPEAPIVARMDECLVAADIPLADLLAWSVALHEAAAAPAQAQAHEQDTNQHQCRCQHQDPLIAVIRELIADNKNMAARLTILEAAQLTPTNKAARTEDEQAEAMSDQEPKPKRRKKQVTYLSAAWFEWYTRVPRVWDCSDRQNKSEFRCVVAFMKLFIPDGFILDDRSNGYKDDVLAVGTRAEKAVL